MKKLKVMTVVGTRPEIIRLSVIINKLEASEAIDHVLVHTGQNYDYELNEVFFKDFNLRKPDYFLDSAFGTAIETIGHILIKMDAVLGKEKPDAFLVLGDTNSCLAAIAAKRKKIPIFHMEAGNRCFDQRVPEETNRKIVDHISDINMPYSSIARENLLKEGIPTDRVIKTGSPINEVLQSRIDKIHNSDVLTRLGLKKGEYFLVSSHREENVDTDNLLKLVDTLNTIAEIYQLPIIVSTHPRTRKKLDAKGVVFHPLVQTLKPLGFIDYNKLQIDSKAVLSDSGTISEESSILKFNALNLREAHERPEAYEEGAVMMVGVNKERILQGLKILEVRDPNVIETPLDYQADNVSEKVLSIIVGYVDYVNANVWRKN